MISVALCSLTYIEWRYSDNQNKTKIILKPKFKQFLFYLTLKSS